MHLAAALGGSLVFSLSASNVFADTFTASYNLPGTGESATSSGPIFSQQSTYFGNGETYFGEYPGALIAGDEYTHAVVLAAAAGNGWGDIPQSDALASFNYQTVITNNSAVAQAYNFNFFLDAGRLYTTGNYVGNVGLHSDFTAAISFGSNQVWGSSGHLFTNAGNSSFSYTGTDIGYSTNWLDFAGGSVSFAAYTGSVSLGYLNPGESAVLNYSLAASASIDGTIDGYYGGAYTSLGDPFSAQQNPLPAGNTFAVTPAVPEPETVAMMGLGLGVVALASRRKKSKKQG